MTVSAAAMMKRSKTRGVELEGLEHGLRAIAAVDVAPEVRHTGMPTGCRE